MAQTIMFFLSTLLIYAVFSEVLWRINPNNIFKDRMDPFLINSFILLLFWIWSYFA